MSLTIIKKPEGNRITTVRAISFESVSGFSASLTSSDDTGPVPRNGAKKISVFAKNDSASSVTLTISYQVNEEDSPIWIDDPNTITVSSGGTSIFEISHACNQFKISSTGDCNVYIWSIGS